MKFHGFWLVIFSAVASGTVTDVSTSKSSDNDTVSFTCKESSELKNLDMQLVLGRWKAKEVYMHLTKEGINEYRSCPDVWIWELKDVKDLPRTTFGPATEHMLYHAQALDAKFRQEYRYLRLLWDEAGQTVEFSLYFQKDSPGYWKSLGSQNGSMTARSSYKQFSGSVQVLKAVNDHLVLHFCQEEPAQLYTVLFSRNPATMPRWEIESVHTFLSTKKLSLASIRTVCKNSANRNYYGLLFSTVTCILAFLIRSS